MAVDTTTVYSVLADAIPAGNFYFLPDHTFFDHSEDPGSNLFETMKNAEQLVKVAPKDCLVKLRLAYDLLAADILTASEYQQALKDENLDEASMSDAQIFSLKTQVFNETRLKILEYSKRHDVTQQQHGNRNDSSEPEENYNSKKILTGVVDQIGPYNAATRTSAPIPRVDLSNLSDHVHDFTDFYTNRAPENLNGQKEEFRQATSRNRDTRLKQEVKNTIYTIYSYCCWGPHTSAVVPQSLALDMLKIFFNLMKVVYRIDDPLLQYDPAKIPTGKYYPVPDRLLLSHSLPLSTLYFSPEIGDSVGYFLLKKNKEGKDEGRETYVLTKVFQRSDGPASQLLHANDQVQDLYTAFRFPSFPLGMKEWIKSRSLTNTDDAVLSVIRSIVNSVLIMHTADPPVYHRALEPDSFIISKTGKGYTAFLHTFETAKAPLNSTVLPKIQKLAERRSEFMPLGPFDETTAWDKVDIFSLGKIINWIVQGTGLQIDEWPALYERMTSRNPEARPDIEEVSRFFGSQLADAEPSIHQFGIVSEQGERPRQEDAFFVAGMKNYQSPHLSEKYTITDKETVFAVFDGIGGLMAGDKASSIAAQALDGYFAEKTDMTADGMKDRMQKAVESYRRYNGLGTIGTTVAAALVNTDGAVSIMAIGDSVAYLFRNGALHLLTKDMSGTVFVPSFIGLDERKRSLKFDTREFSLMKNDLLILATDGFSDMIQKGDPSFRKAVTDVLKGGLSFDEKLDEITKIVKEQDLSDNCTLIMYERL